MAQSPADMIASLLPFILLTSLPWAIGAFYLAPKLGRNRWLWAIAMLIPLINIIVSYIFFFSAFGIILDRLNALSEREKNAATFT